MNAISSLFLLSSPQRHLAPERSSHLFNTPVVQICTWSWYCTCLSAVILSLLQCWISCSGGSDADDLCTSRPWSNTVRRSQLCKFRYACITVTLFVFETSMSLCQTAHCWFYFHVLTRSVVCQSVPSLLPGRCTPVSRILEIRLLPKELSVISDIVWLMWSLSSRNLYQARAVCVIP